MAQGRVRNSNLDVLRCLTMFLIVLHHTYHHGMYYDATSTLTILFDVLLLWHVDVFISFSGWFGIRFDWNKLIRLWSVIVFYSIVSFVFGRFVLHESTPFRINGGWFGNVYLCLILIVPLLNAGIERLVEKGVLVAWRAWVGFAVVIWINWLSKNSYVGFVAYDIGTYGLIQLIFVYTTVRMFRLTNVQQVAKLWHCLLVIGLFVALAFVLPTSRQNYLAPHVIGVSLAILVLFEKYVRFPDWLGRLGVFAAPAMFGVYLIHETTSFGRELYGQPLRYFGECGMPPVLSIFLSAACCFGVGVVVDLVRSFGARLIGVVIDNGRKEN